MLFHKAPSHHLYPQHKRKCYLLGGLTGTDVILSENSCLEIPVGKFGIRFAGKVEEHKLHSGWMRSVCSGNSS